jgi:exonuclease SbcC
VDAQIVALSERRRAMEAERAAVAEQLVPLATAAERRNEAERRLESARARASRLAQLAARQGEVLQSQAALAAIEAELAQLAQTPPAETGEEATEQVEITAARDRIASEREGVRVARDEAIARVDAALAAMPAAFDGRRVSRSREASAEARRRHQDAERAHLSAVRRQERRAMVQAQLERARAGQAEVDARAALVESELSGWTLLARCLSNDGVIALDIDDAGPTLASLANDLLLACYGRRFTLEIRTQVATARGDVREGFDIIVHDGQGGEPRSVTLLSGGERVWLNEALTRAIALYLAGNAGREYGTLFCDEADGPLDPERKRMFMDMKREVIRLGGYEREFFVSQTPELTAMADKVIDLDALALAGEEAQ